MKYARKIVYKILGVDLREMNSVLNDIAYQTTAINNKLDHVSNLVSKDHDLIKSQRDNLDYQRKILYDIRTSSAYVQTLKDTKPLISVCIATYNKSKDLVEVALKSVFEQTYQNFEIIIIGDNCVDDTEKRLKSLNDKRITFINLPNRGPYPDDPTKRWMVAGAPGVDLAATIAKGKWIARLDDDDMWSNDHLEKLLKLAIGTRSEFVYGALERKNVITGKTHLIYEEIPSFGQISFQGVLYMRLLNFFHYDQQSYLVDEPTDWNLIRRMVEAGVHFASTPDVVGTINWIPNNSKKHR